ncbi:MAG: hypothetical protein JNM25_01200 [Planctomycetes bacterium]|nr:hypothetical protein [Planctomycetota bacterium]
MSSSSATAMRVTGIGLVGALGTRAANVLAAQRCNLVRTSPSTELRIPDEDTLTEQPVRVHAVRGLAAGYEHQGRWVRLLSAALQDLATGLESGDATALPLVVVRPADDPDRYPVETAAAGLDELLSQALTAPRTAFACHVVPGAEGSIAVALDQVAELLRQHRRVVLAGVDSLVDHCSLAWLLRAGRLKTDDNPVGIAPGETAACFLLERADPTGPTGGLAEIADWWRDDEVDTEAEPELWGQRLGRAVNRSMHARANEPSRPHTPWHLVSNHDGDTAMARIHGGLLSTLDPGLAAPRLHHPCVSFGSVGCASAFVGMAVAIHVLATDPASRDVVATAASPRGEAALVRLRR